MKWNEIEEYRMQMSFIELKSIESAFNGDEKSFEKMK
jgi:hypothetical protein